VKRVTSLALPAFFGFTGKHPPPLGTTVIAVLTMGDQQEIAYGLSHGAMLNDLELPLTKISRSRHYLMPNISKTVRDTDTVTTEY